MNKMAQTSYHMHVSNAIKRIQERFKTIDPADLCGQTGPTPLFKNMYPKRINIQDNLAADAGPDAILDIQPDFRNIILYINYFVTHHYPDFDTKSHPCLTPMSLTGYLLAIVYAAALHNDCENVRGEKSDYAKEFCTTKGLDRIASLLKRMPVPPFMQSLLSSLYTANDERKENIKYVFTLACFDLKYDFSRTPPIMIYFAAHHLISTLQTNQPPEQVLQTWYLTQIMAAPTPLHVYNYMGIHLGNHDYVNWFTEIHLSLFNPVTTRSNTLRPTFRHMLLHAQDLDVPEDHVNPYIHLLGLDPDNIHTTESILTDLATTVHDLYPDSVLLGQIEYETKGNQIMNHYYQRVLLPTGHLCRADPKCDPAKPAVYAKASTFKVKPSPKATIKISDPGLSSEIAPTLYLASRQQYSETDDPIKFDPFDRTDDVVDDIRHFCPFETKNEDIYYSIIKGVLVECEEIDSASVPQPNPHNTISRENSYFLESAIPLSRIRPLIPTENDQFDVIARDINRPQHPVVRADLFDRSIDRLPFFNRIIHDAIPDRIPGFNPVPGIRQTSLGCTSLCYTIASGTNSTVISTGTRLIRAWSSIRYLNTNQHHNVDIRNRKYMLINARTIHGTNITLVQTPHPSKCIPRI